jgi:VanZ family protein
MARRLPKIGIAVLAVYWVLLFIATHIPKVPGPQFSWGDKIAHFCAYAGLAYLAAMALRLKHVAPRIVYPAVILCAAIYGAIDEWLQIYTGRDASLYDWLADMLGAATGLALFALTYHPLRRWYYRNQPERADALRADRPKRKNEPVAP